MKKVFYFAAVAAMFAACSSEELADQAAIQQDANGTPVNFSVYTSRGITRAGTDSTITTENLKNGYHKDDGFGIFAYYTVGEKYDQKATPNFMYNQQVKWNGSKWAYEPVKYWPNEFGNAATSDDIDYLTFFSYAPWVKVVPTTGEIDVTGLSATAADSLRKYNITKVTKNSAMGDPLIYYTVDTDPATSVDLLWGVAAEGAQNNYSPISADGGSKVDPGMPFIDLVKPTTGSDKLSFNLMHALAKMQVTIDYVADSTLLPQTAPSSNPKSAVINPDETRIYLRSITMSGFALKGVLNLNNEKDSLPNWKAEDGVSDLVFDDITFYDGRKDGAEGATGGEQSNENPGKINYLNPELIENTGNKIPATSFKDNGKTPGILPIAQNLFVSSIDTTALKNPATVKNGNWFYVIPRGNKEPVNIEINYDVQTMDSVLANKLADKYSLGSLINNKIRNENIFQTATSTEPVDIEAGKVYVIKIHVGMNSVKVEAEVTPWATPANEADPTLPHNTTPANP